MIDNCFEVIDAHCHVYPDKIAKVAVKGTADFYGISTAADGTVKGLIDIGNNAGIDHFIVQSVATTPHQVQSINNFIANEVALHADRLIGLGALHPNSEDIKADVFHILELGLKGVKLHPDIQRFKIDDPKCATIYSLCQKYKLPILMHTGDYRYDFSNANRLVPVLDEFDDLTVIGAHFGGWSVWEDSCQKLAGRKNFYVDCCSSFEWITNEYAVKLIHAYGADRVLFGSDYPIFHPEKELQRFMQLDLTSNEKRLILSENVKSLYNI